MLAGSSLTREDLRQLDAGGQGKKRGALASLLPHMNLKNKKQRTKPEEAALKRCIRAHASKAAEPDSSTRGISLPALKAVVCLDTIGAECYVDIQRCSGPARTTILPEQLHCSLQEWTPMWTSGSGLLNRSQAATFWKEAVACDRSVGALVQDLFGDDD